MNTYIITREPCRTACTRDGNTHRVSGVHWLQLLGSKVWHRKGDSTCLAWYLSDVSSAVCSDQFNKNLQCVCRPPVSPLHPAPKECLAPHRKSMSTLNQLCPVRKALLTWLSTLCSEMHIWSLTLITACRAKVKWFSFSFYVLRPLSTLWPQYWLS